MEQLAQVIEFLGQSVPGQVTQAAMGLLLLIGALQYLLGPEDDWVEEPRERILRSIHECATLIGAYSVRNADPDGFACRIAVTDEDIPDGKTAADVVEKILYQTGFHRNILASKKYRRIDGTRVWADSSWVHRDRFLGQTQLHATIFSTPSNDRVDETHHFDIYTHDEYSNIRHPVRHVLGSGVEYDTSIEKFHSMLDAAGIEYTVSTAPPTTNK